MTAIHQSCYRIAILVGAITTVSVLRVGELAVPVALLGLKVMRDLLIPGQANTDTAQSSNADPRDDSGSSQAT